MLKLITKAQALWATKDRGATAVEYGLMVALIAAAIAATVFLLGDALDGIFSDTEACVSAPSAAACP